MELPGQMTLFDVIEIPTFEMPVPVTGDREQTVVAAHSEESLGDDGIELCDECGTACTSSKECAELSGLYDEEES